MIELRDDALDVVSGGLQAVLCGSGTPDDPYEVAGAEWAVGDRVRLDFHPVGDVPCNEFWNVYGRIDAIAYKTKKHQREERRAMNYHSYPYASRRMVTFGSKGMVSTSQSLAAQAGLDILKKGGNAIDAAIAAAVCLTVVQPTSNGIGSDAFALIWTENKLHGLNASGKAPAALTPEEMAKKGHRKMPVRGLEPVTVPGAPGAWIAMSRRFGRLPFAELFEAGIHYARDGFVVSPSVNEMWEDGVALYSAFKGRSEFDEWFRVFAPEGRAPLAGEVFKLPDHAKTLEEIAATEAESFYRGALADKMDAAMRRQGGWLRKEDLAEFAVEWVNPISVRYHGYDVCEIPPNGQGIIALMALNILNEMDVRSADDPLCWHRAIEAVKLAACDAHAFVTDPREMKVSVEELLSPEFAAQRRGEIGERAVMPTAGNPVDGGTVYLCTADEEGNMVSFIQSNFNGFGSGIVVPDTGIALQNRGCGFSLDPGHVNYLAGGKKTFHTIIPGFLMKDDRPVGPFGVMGGAMQPQGHVQVMINLIDRGLNPQAALDMPRWMWQKDRDIIVEPSVPYAIVQALQEMGHNVSYSILRAPFGRGDMILRTEFGTYAGATEPRADGCVAAW